MHKRLITLITAAFLISSAASAQSLGLSTNALGWGTLTPNLGVDVALAKRLTIGVDAGLNPFTFSNDRSSQFFAVQPDMKIWPVEKFRGPSIGIHGTYGNYDFGMRRYIYKGTMYGGGLTFGYAWAISKRWNLEASVGGGYTRLDHSNVIERSDKYSCYGPSKVDKWGLSQAGIKFTYLLGKSTAGRKAVFAKRAEKAEARKASSAMPDMYITAPSRVDTVYIVKETSRGSEYKEVAEERNFRFDFLLGGDKPIDPSLKAIIDYIYDPSIVSYVFLTNAYCSPEGGSEDNMGLAQRRSDNVRSLLSNLGIQMDKIASVIDGPAWDGLSEMISSSSLANKSAIQQILAGSGHDPSVFKTISEKYPEDWEIIKGQVFPALRTVSVYVKVIRKTEK